MAVHGNSFMGAVVNLDIRSGAFPPLANFPEELELATDIKATTDTDSLAVSKYTVDLTRRCKRLRFGQYASGAYLLPSPLGFDPPEGLPTTLKDERALDAVPAMDGRLLVNLADRTTQDRFVKSLADLLSERGAGIWFLDNGSCWPSLGVLSAPPFAFEYFCQLYRRVRVYAQDRNAQLWVNLECNLSRMIGKDIESFADSVDGVTIETAATTFADSQEIKTFWTNLNYLLDRGVAVCFIPTARERWESNVERQQEMKFFAALLASALEPGQKGYVAFSPWYPPPAFLWSYAHPGGHFAIDYANRTARLLAAPPTLSL